MEIDLISQTIVPIAGALIAIAGSLIAVLTLMHKRKAHRIVLAEKLYEAKKSESKLLAMEVFYQLFGLRYQYSDIEILSDDNDALQKLTMLKRRRDAVTFIDGKYDFYRTHQGVSRSINLLIHKVFMWGSAIIVIASLVLLLFSRFSAIGFAVFITLIIIFILLGIFSGNELYWYCLLYTSDAADAPYV